MILDNDADSKLRDVEETVIAHLIKHPDEIAVYSNRLPATAFLVRAYRVIYQILLDLDREERPIDAVQVEICAVQRNLLESIGGVETIARIAGGNKLVRKPSAKSIASSLIELVERYKRAQMQERTRYLQSALSDPTVPFADLVLRVEQWAIDFMSADEPAGALAPIQETISTTLEAAIGRTIENREGKNPGISTGWVDLDRLTGGWRGGKLITIAARPHMGKSLFVGNTLMAIAETRPVALFSLEMSTGEIEERFLSAVSGVDSAKIRDGRLDDAEIDRLVLASAKLSACRLWGNDSTSTTVDSIVSEARRFKAKHPNLGGIGIDYLQLMCQGDNPNQEISKMTRKLKCLAGELDCPIFILSQLSRGVESRTDKRPIMSDLRDSGAIEQDSDVIIMLYRDVVYNPTTNDPNIAEAIVRKFRNGSCGTVRLVFDGACSQFKNLL